MTPEPLKIIVTASLVQEYMHQIVAVIHQNPLRVIVPFDADRHLALLLQL